MAGNAINGVTTDITAAIDAINDAIISANVATGKGNTKKVKVCCKLDDTVYILDRQALVKTYVNRIVFKQWFTDAGKKKTKTTYCVPDEEVGEQVEKTQFVSADFGKIIFTNKNTAWKKFKKLSKYAKKNTKVGAAAEPEDDQYVEPAPYRDIDDQRDNTPKDPTPNIGDWIKMPDDNISDDNKDDNSENNREKPDNNNRTSYYDSTGKKVYPNSSGKFTDAKGDIIKVNYYDPYGNTVFHTGNYLGRGSYVYDDGSIVPKEIKILRYMELYGNASIKDGIQTSAIIEDGTPDHIDIDDSTTKINT